ncbi:DDHD domain-containing protein [Lipomyces kononenkoae]|uniref:DDHD domain-containing protein n=1 Tax=Lipomyces kononenkoae TaxID=34357 RepID=A0ACC3SUP2_LIPKO
MSTPPVVAIKTTETSSSLSAAVAGAEANKEFQASASSLHSSVDHTVPYRHRMSHNDLPPDTPPLVVRWYFATDIPKTKPLADKDWKPPKPPSKFVPFSVTDSRSIEAAYQQKDDSKLDTVAVNEDRLFQVDIRKRELSPLYWNGPTYDVRRGTWFYADSSTLKPCDENLANQIEEGYLKNQPFRKPAHVPIQRANSDPPPITAQSPPGPLPPLPLPTSDSESQGTSSISGSSVDQLRDGTEAGSQVRASTSFAESISNAFTFRSRSPSTSDPPQQARSSSSDRKAPESDKPVSAASAIVQQTSTWPLYGPHMGKYVVYSNDAITAWIISDDFYGKFASTIYQRLTAGASMGGIKIVRGWSDVKAKPPSKPPSTATAASSGPETDVEMKNESESTSAGDQTAKLVEAIRKSSETSISIGVKERQEAQDNALLAQQMEKDYNPDEDEDQSRDIEHLVLCIHGIGQKLGQRLESVNFVGDVNTFRKTLKSVYSTSPDLQTLNGETGNDVKKLNSRIQVLPVCWRHSIQFGLQQDIDEDPAKSRKERDIGDQEEENGKKVDDETATLQDITIDGVPALRGIISEVLLDILLYYQPNYRERIMNNVTSECNRIYHLFRKWNPNFKGRVSIVGHSLGAAIAFDILCRQPDNLRPSKSKSPKVTLDFDVDSFFGVGSPVGLFQMLKGKTIAPRTVRSIDDIPMSPLDFDLDNPFEAAKRPVGTVSTPKVEDIYNIFHPADPISYRLEPLIVKRMAELKPQAIPSSRKGLNSQIANIAELTQRVAQSASNMWSSMASGLASTILHKSLGYEADASGTFNAPGDGNGGASPSSEATSSSFRQDLAITIHNPPETGVETLYSKFQKESEKLTKAAEEHAKLQRDEELIRGLNYTGRLDFSLQEGYMDITLLASMGSHLGYFRDPDVANFVIGQLLARPYPKRLKSSKSMKQKYKPLS